MTMLRALHVALLISLIWSGGVRAEQVSLTPDQMIATAARALSVGRPDATVALTQAILAQNPDHLSALLLQARALRDLGRADEARKPGQRAWQLARRPDDKFTAAVIMAQITSSDGNRTASQLWLRRASQHATSDAQHALIRRDFNYVKSRNPWRFNLSGGVMPNSNINGGSNQDTITLFGLPFELSPDAQALSGYQAQVSGSLSYRIHQNDKSQTQLGIKGYARWNEFSEESKAAAPDARASDYNYQSAALTLAHTRSTNRPGQELTFGIEAGRSWYGGEQNADFVNTHAQLQTRLNNGRHLTFSARADTQKGADPGSEPLFVGKLGVSYFAPLKNGNAYRLSTSVQKGFSDDAYQAYDAQDLTFEYFLARPILRSKVMLGLQLGRKDYALSIYSPDGRHDVQASVFADFRLQDASIYGFSPVVTLRREHTSSNVSLNSSDRSSIEIGFRSDF